MAGVHVTTRFPLGVGVIAALNVLGGAFALIGVLMLALNRVDAGVAEIVVTFSSGGYMMLLGVGLFLLRPGAWALGILGSVAGIAVSVLLLARGDVMVLAGVAFDALVLAYLWHVRERFAAVTADPAH